MSEAIVTKAKFWVDNLNLNGESGWPVLESEIKSDGKFTLQYDNIIPESLRMTSENFTELSQVVDRVIVDYFKALSSEQALQCAVTDLVKLKITNEAA